MADFENELFDWDSEIESDGQEYVTVQPGDYAFTVTKVERQNYPGNQSSGGKIPACNLAVVSGEIDVPKGKATFRERLYLYKGYEWKLSAFFRSLGLKKHGEKLRMNFNEAVGKRGMAKFGNHEYNGSKYNQVEQYYDYDPDKLNSFSGFKEVKDEDVPW
jgi:hypothetical protein